MVKDISVEESNKLEGVVNYSVWWLKMRAISRRENLWDIIENVVTPTTFPTIVSGV
jgi:hypothetical protein